MKKETNTKSSASKRHGGAVSSVNAKRPRILSDLSARIISEGSQLVTNASDVAMALRSGTLLVEAASSFSETGLRSTVDKQAQAELDHAIEVLKEHSARFEEQTEKRLIQLSESEAFLAASTTDLVLLKKFADRRDSLLRTYDFIIKDDVAQILGYSNSTPSEKHNLNRRLRSMRDRGKLLFATYQGEEVYPTFQFDRSGQIHSSLLKWLPRLIVGRSGWDICFWLDSEQRVLMTKAVATQEQVDRTINDFDAYDALVEQESVQSNYLTAKPMDLLSPDRAKDFDEFCKNWTYGEHRNIPEKDVRLEAQ